MIAPELEVRPLGPALGAEIAGVRIAPDLDAAVIAAIRRVWLEHLVVFFRDVELTPEALLGFAQRFAEPVAYPMLRGLPDHPLIVAVEKRAHEQHNFGGVWHSDTAYLRAPPIGAMLLARVVPPLGGDTLFANQYLAYETLSPSLQQVLSGLNAVNSSAKAAVTQTRAERMVDGARVSDDAHFEAVHPVVRIHPETGRRLLYVNCAHTLRFDGWTEEESAPLLEFLFRHQTRPEFTCRLRWRAGSLALWDNRACQHNPINDYHGHHRLMHRVSLGSERPQ